MNATAANLMERVLPPESGLRQWVLTFPFSWRRRLAQDGALLGRLTRITVETVLAFYAARAGEEGRPGAKSGAVIAVQRTSSDLRLNPHLHVIALDGAWCEEDGELAWEGLRHLRTSEVGEVLERVVRRMERHLRRNGQLRTFEDEAEADGESDPEGNLRAELVARPDEERAAAPQATAARSTSRHRRCQARPWSGPRCGGLCAWLEVGTTGSPLRGEGGRRCTVPWRGPKWGLGARGPTARARA